MASSKDLILSSPPLGPRPARPEDKLRGRLEGRTAPIQQQDKRVCVGIITGPQGIRGAVRVKSFTAEPRDVARYGPVADASGERTFRLRLAGTAKGVMIVTIDGVTTRNQAETLRGLQLYLPRAALPMPSEDEYYHADLIGLAAMLADDTIIGRVRAVHDFGAGDMLEVERGVGPPVMVPFTRAIVPVVDITNGRLRLDPPPGLLEPVPEEPSPAPGERPREVA